MFSICVFCGSSKGRNLNYIKLAHALGEILAQKGYKLIYGGGGLGLMGAVASASHKARGCIRYYAQISFQHRENLKFS